MLTFVRRNPSMWQQEINPIMRIFVLCGCLFRFKQISVRISEKKAAISQLKLQTFHERSLDKPIAEKILLFSEAPNQHGFLSLWYK